MLMAVVSLPLQTQLIRDVWPDHATFLGAQLTVCLGLEYLCRATGGPLARCQLPLHPPTHTHTPPPATADQPHLEVLLPGSEVTAIEPEWQCLSANRKHDM